MEPRLNLFGVDLTPKFSKYINSAGKVVTDSTLPATVQELVKIRASQINGCGVCTDMHTKDAAHAGETPVRLNLVAAWHEATVFTDAERAASSSPSRAPASPMPPVGSATRPGRTRPSTTTTTSWPPSCV